MRILMMADRICVEKGAVTVSPCSPLEVKLPGGAASWDMITDGGTLKMLPRDHETICEVMRLLRPGGLYALEITEVETKPVNEDEE